MTLEQAIHHCKEVAEQYEAYGIETECYECGKEHRQLAEWLEDYKQLRKENDELKRLLMLAMDSMQVMSRADGCIACSQCNYEAPIGEDENGDFITSPHCDKSDCFEWVHHDEAMKLLGAERMPLPDPPKGDRT